MQEGLELFDAEAAQELGKLLHVVVRTVDGRKQDLKDVSDFIKLFPILLALLIECEALLHPHSKAEDKDSAALLTHEAISSLISICNFQEADRGLFNQSLSFHSAVGELVGRIEASNVETWHPLSDEVGAM